MIFFLYLFYSYDWAAIPAALAGALFLYALICTPFVIVDSRYVQIVPYFSDRFPGANTFLCGQAIAKSFQILEQFAKDRGIVPLSEFCSEDDLDGAEVTWHDPAEGMKAIAALRTALRLPPDALDDSQLIESELSKINASLEEAIKNKSRFCFLIREGTMASGHEMSLRKGYFGFG